MSLTDLTAQALQELLAKVDELDRKAMPKVKEDPWPQCAEPTLNEFLCDYDLYDLGDEVINAAMRLHDILTPTTVRCPRCGCCVVEPVTDTVVDENDIEEEIERGYSSCHFCGWENR